MAVEALIAALGVIGSVCAAILASRSQTMAVLSGLTKTLQDRVAELEAQVRDLWDERRKDAGLIRRMGDHIDVLEDHIRQEKGPPPPPRPEGL
ncbi:MAG: hypothetical protein LBK42_14410 [Propionibacteriaceae bacterium]|jgi:hypothetical protein|nr:hypothetical protein [Propionibacteriaceae bacterium]